MMMRITPHNTLKAAGREQLTLAFGAKSKWIFAACTNQRTKVTEARTRRHSQSS
jgi:hypothetical protein